MYSKTKFCRNKTYEFFSHNYMELKRQNELNYIIFSYINLVVSSNSNTTVLVNKIKILLVIIISKYLSLAVVTLLVRE